MKQQKFVFYRYSFQEDPDTIPEKRVAEEKISTHFGNLFHVGEKLTMYMKKGKADVSLRNDTFAVCKDIIVFRLNDDKDLKRTLPTGTTTNAVDDYAENTGKQGRPRKDNRIIMNRIVWLARSGAPWRDLPERYGSKCRVPDPRY